MEIKLGEKIRTLRKQKNISQEVLAQYLGISFQAVSKWENGTALPDVAVIPAIASFFGVSTDELFDFNRFEFEKRIEQIVLDSVKYRQSDPEKCEEILRAGLKKYPGNDILLNNLLYVLDMPDRQEEIITICQSLIAGTKDDAVKYDACRILAETYREMGEYALCKQTLEMIPEIYFTKLELQAALLQGEDMLRPARAQRNLSAESLVEMLMRLGDYHEKQGNLELAANKRRVAQKIILAMKDEISDLNSSKRFYEYYGVETYQKLEEKLKEQ